MDLVSVVIVLWVSQSKAFSRDSTVTQPVKRAMTKTAAAKGSMTRYEKR